MTSWISISVNLGSSLIVLPLVLHYFSSTELALWLFFAQIMALGSIVDFGFGPAVIRAVSYFVSGAERLPSPGTKFSPAPPGTPPNRIQLQALLGTMHWLYLGLALIGTFLTAVGGAIAARNLLRLAGDHQEHWVALGLQAISLGLALHTVMFSSFQQGFGELPRVRLVEAGIGIARIALVASTLLWGGRLLALAIVQVATQAVIWLSLRHGFQHSWKRTMGAASAAGPFDRGLFSELWPSTWRQGIIGVGGYFINQSGGLLAAQLKDATQVSRYLLTLRLFGLVRQMAQAPIYSSIPHFTRLRAQGDLSELRRLFAKRITLTVALLAGALFGFVLTFNWGAAALGKPRLLVDGWLYGVMALGLVLEVHHCCHSYLYVTTNHVPFVAASLISGGAVIAFGLLLLPRYAVTGIIMAQFLVQLSFNNWYPVMLLLRNLDWSFGGYLRDCWRAATKLRSIHNGL